MAMTIRSSNPLKLNLPYAENNIGNSLYTCMIINYLGFDMNRFSCLAISFKNTFMIHEGQIANKIFFIDEGKIAMAFSFCLSLLSSSLVKTRGS